MNEISSLINILALTQLSGSNTTNQCNCTYNNSSGFDMIMMTLLKALSQNNQQTSNGYNLLSNSENLFNELDNVVNNTASRFIDVDTKDKNVKSRIENAVEQASKKYNVDANLIKAIIKVESDFNPNTVSSAGAKGLMQLMPENCRDLGVTDPFNIEQNIDAGTRHIKEYIDMFGGSIEMGLMAYNGGPGRMKSRGVESISDLYKMPKETQNYIPKVMKYYRG
ncbi:MULTISPECIES: lytic transglycosylase domain-containing protein [unclassified Clostridioides]|uniref:lytic transglycosylase domain-containing protein n=1 Tax=unclassified Clostridioides TaxID=2635829 RepID=UPI001D0F668E|nr:lytic transglycosylase domain-containing protein [Clostridioides sp. ZZV14-6150]MCC0661056.1 lytic transglycosylase domain-containing protein [Clostridioides sp. ZZV14-6154]MCC0668228.1 lytic transglycosylase domain-containing protein [Clostridioides sp. ZZV14-6153]MCC0722523.1 lytic transglycosylase domain-containing protein [Clostridioides sp. ZZV14-6104]MCC0738210.1 lytic transglycosylase domain-containing protein [Clostridioides sp. ZZV14-5902]MCC0743340.1 lytic transglycosylase domain-